jgi:hypothetical protein
VADRSVTFPAILAVWETEDDLRYNICLILPVEFSLRSVATVGYNSRIHGMEPVHLGIGSEGQYPQVYTLSSEKQHIAICSLFLRILL